MRSSGSLIVSLDLELYWGVRDRLTLDQYRETLLGTRVVVPRMLALFEEFGIHATWLVVGFLFFENRDDLLAGLPASLPSYRDPNLSPYPHLAQVGADEASDPFHFGRGLIEQIRRAPGQEIGTHTFSHFYCLEPGQDVEQFRADLEAAMRAARGAGVEITSLVFPRNQVAPAYLGVCADLGITTYRGTEDSWLYRPTAGSGLSLVRRALRLADAYVDMSGSHAFRGAQAVEPRLVNLRASRFLRPVSRRLRYLEGARRRRITAAMTHAARRGLIYHLWWHPENYGRAADENLAFLRDLLEHYRALSTRYGMRSLTMREQRAILLGEERPGIPATAKENGASAAWAPHRQPSLASDAAAPLGARKSGDARS